MQSNRRFLSFGCGAAIGTLGGLIGLGGAEFRLPLLIGLFGFGALEAVILNKAMSLVVVAAALPLRAYSVPFSAVFERWDIILTLLSGSLAGAWFGAGWATRLKSKTLYRIISGLLVAIAILLLFGHEANAQVIHINAVALAIVGAMAGVVIGVVASLMGVAGGELLIPTIVLLFGANIKLAGSLSLAVSLPTMITGFSRYSRDQSFSVIRQQSKFIIIMAIGSLVGAFLGGQLLGLLPTHYLLPVLAGILVISSFKVWRHA
ncbi:sulfite exporter TauE/SafE family protein [uncultured Tolumonas sp.]|uniref:sulfite exporter TauE/SafE family protein n=1 Tax=uncultured Tolumonas sp. TaxID=263765 RepID=UPI002A0A1EC4|nr:sulfite exporter TauE/SafE family protein [uncultured Tolumonas sp.]